MNKSTLGINPASFRDPSGFVFSREDKIFRAIAPGYFENLALLQDSKLYDKLVSKQMLVSHSIENNAGFLPAEYSEYKIIQPEKIPFISYPYEWCFSQLKKAALLTLSIQKEALKHGMSLKDASAYNVQFIGTQPIFIDTLSFEKYEEGTPWSAYGQFCRHFLAPLALISYRHTDLSKLSQLFIDGIPLELTNTLLPRRSLANTVVLSHLNLHAKFQSSHSDPGKTNAKTSFLSKNKLITLLDHMADGIAGFSLKEKRSTWNNYDETHNYTAKGKEEKEKVISGWLQTIKPITVWDLGCNTGEYSFLAARHSKYVLAIDSDHLCVEKMHNTIFKNKITNILPLEIDLTNPSPAIGWNNLERKKTGERGKADLLLALALIHHLRISNNTPWKHIAKLFSEWGNQLIVEFIPKDDSQIQRMIKNRQDIFNDIDVNSFERSFENYFNITEKYPVTDSGRILYLLNGKQ